MSQFSVLDLLSDWALYTADPQPLLIRFAQKRKEYLSLLSLRKDIILWLRWRHLFILINGTFFFLLLK